MKYTKKFITQLIKYCRTNDLPANECLEKFEIIYLEQHINFPYDKLEKIVCDYYDVDINEIHSTFKYGNLPLARKMICYMLDQCGMKNKHIVKLTGFLPAFISIALRKVNGHYQQDINNLTEQIKSQIDYEYQV